MHPATAHVPLPDLEMRDGTPVSAMFDDVYFSRAGGIAETTHVFLNGNELPQRWNMKNAASARVASHGEPLAAGVSNVVAKGTRSPSRNSFTIAETGFGTGLNFLVAWKAFVESAPAHQHLHYISVEKFPLTPTMLREALAAYPELSPYADQLIAAYPLRLPNFHRIHFPRVTLTLGFGDAVALLAQLTTSIDAWFLDGFSPAKNTEMWSDALFTEIGRLSQPNTTFATFTSAGFVRRGLAACGFTVKKIAGYGHKREMSVGIFDGGLPPCPLRVRGGSPSATRPESSDGCSRRVGFHPEPEGVSAAWREGGETPPSKIMILGGGIAGCTLAHALAERGLAVTLLERGDIAGAASGNPAGVLFPQLTKRWAVSAAWYFSAYSFALQQLARWRQLGLAFACHEVGMLRVPRHAEEEKQLRQLTETLGLDAAIVQWVEQAEAAARAGVELATGAAFFPRGTWVAPAELCRALLTHPNITHHTHCAVTSLQQQGGEWQATARDGTVFAAERCCVAAAYETAAFFPSVPLRVAQVGGQISSFAARDVAAPLSTILCHKGYVIPRGDAYLIGATYNHGDPSCAVTDENHEKNIADVKNFLPDWLRGAPVSGRTSLRTTTPDRLPYIGAIAPNAWISAGHGSRGLLSAPLAAEIIASEICGEVLPITHELRSALNPLRFSPKTSPLGEVNEPSRVG